MWIIILVGIFTLFAYLKIFKINNYWKDKSVSYLKPWPIIGNMSSIILQKKEVSHIIQQFYNAYPNKRYVGIYQFRTPTLLIRDPGLIRRITVKHFENFPEHSLFNTDENDVPKNKGLFSLGARSGWSDMRKNLNPAFAPNKMKEMFDLINQCADQLIDHLKECDNSIGVNTKETFTKLNCNVLASTIFGYTCNCLKNPPHDLYDMGNQINDFSGLRFIRIFATSISMTLTKLFQIELADMEVFLFFMRLIKESLKNRTERKKYRPDMINFMLDTKKEFGSSNTDSDHLDVQEESVFKRKKNPLNEDEMAMQLFGFFIGGYDAIAALLSYSAYELAVNPHIQEQLRKEIDGMTKEEITYNVLMSMEYLDMVVSEVLRKWPIAVFIDRKCLKQFLIEPEQPDEKELIIEPGIICWIPIYAIHRDPKYYPDPEKFDPERFNETNKHRIKRSVYFPFGAGPRTCIASKMSVYVCKLILVRVLQNFEIQPCEDTKAPSEVSKIVIFLSGGGCKVNFKSRKNAVNM